MLLYGQDANKKDERVDKVTRQFRCGVGLAETCTQVSQARRTKEDGLSFSFTETRSSGRRLLFVRQRLLFAVPKRPPQIASLRMPSAFAAAQVIQESALVYRQTASGRPEDFRGGPTSPGGGTSPTITPTLSSGDVHQMSNMATLLHAEALKAQSESRQFVANQRVGIEQNAAIADQWNSAAVGGSSGAVLSIMNELSKNDDTSIAAGELEFDRVITEGRRELLNVPDILVEGEAVARFERDFTTSFGNGSFFEAAAAADALNGAVGLTPDAAKLLAAVRGSGGVYDFSRGNLQIPASPLSSTQLLTYAGTPQGGGVRFVANQYTAAWAEFRGLDQLDQQERFLMVAGLALVNRAAASGLVGDWRRRDAELHLANGLLEVVRGFSAGFAEAVVDAIRLIPEAAVMLSSAAQLLTARPEVQMEAAAGALRAVPEIPAAIHLAVATVYQRWENGNAEERATIVGKIVADVLIGFATGEVVPYLRGMAGVEVVRTAAARGIIAQSLSSIEAARIGKAIELVGFEGGQATATRLATLLRENPEAAIELARMRHAISRAGGDVSSFGNLVQQWDVLDGKAVRFATDEQVSRVAQALANGEAAPPLDLAATKTWATKYQAFKSKEGDLNAIAPRERTVVRAIPRFVMENGVRKELTPDDAWRVSGALEKSVGRYKHTDEFVWSTTVIDPTRGKPSAWQTAIAE